jgi:hypothetical protein
MSTNNTPTLYVGHNKMPLAELLPIATAVFQPDVDALAKRADTAPRIVTGRADMDVASALVKDAKALFKKIETARKEMKQPFLDGGKLVDGHYGDLTERLDRIATTFQKAADAFTAQQVEQERQRRLAEAERIRQEEAAARELAEAANEAGKAPMAETMGAMADAAAYEARQIEREATGSAADLVRSVTSDGVLTSAKTQWDYAILDFAAVDLDVLRPYLKRDAIEAAIRMAIRQGVRPIDGRQPIRGVQIFQDVKAVIR